MRSFSFEGFTKLGSGAIAGAPSAESELAPSEKLLGPAAATGMIPTLSSATHKKGTRSFIFIHTTLKNLNCYTICKSECTDGSALLTRTLLKIYPRKHEN